MALDSLSVKYIATIAPGTVALNYVRIQKNIKHQFDTPIYYTNENCLNKYQNTKEVT